MKIKKLMKSLLTKSLPNNNKKTMTKIAQNTKKVSSSAPKKVIEKTFGGLTESEINEIVSDTARGVKAVINGDKLEYYFKSGSGKKTIQTKMKLSKTKELIITFLPFLDAKSPRAFIAALDRAIRNN